MGQALQVTQICSSDSSEAGGADNCLVLEKVRDRSFGVKRPQAKIFCTLATLC